MESKVSMMDWLTLPRFLRSSFEVKGMILSGKYDLLGHRITKSRIS